MFCINCGEKTLEGAAFCGNCGTEIPEMVVEDPQESLRTVDTSLKVLEPQPVKHKTGGEGYLFQFLHRKPDAVAQALASF